MEWDIALFMMLGLVCGGMAFGLPVAFAFFGANIIGAVLFLGGGTGVTQMARNSMVAINTFMLAPIPLFLLMGEILFHTGVAMKAIEVIGGLIRRLPGRLSVISIVGGTVFSSLSGSTIATTAVLGKIILPDMLDRGYKPTMAMGPIMATGGIAMLIPPSALAVLLGSLSGIPVSQLLIAGIIPGLMMSAFFLSYVIGRCALNPSLAPADATPPEDASGAARWIPFLIYVAPLFVIFAVVVGSIFAGWASPTESAALGCLASVIASAAYGRLSLQNFKRAIRETAKVSTMILFIIAASVTFSQILAFSGATDGLLDAMGELEMTPFFALLAMLAVLLFLGAFMDQVSMLLLTLPFFLPLAEIQGIELLWLGVLMLIAMEISLLTPPFGLLLFVMKGVAPANTRITQIYAAAMPFIFLEFAVLALLIAFPVLATWLPLLIAR